MALQWEILKSVVVALLALLRASGGPSLPTPSIVALIVLQTLSLFGALLTPLPKDTGKDDVSPVAAAASVAARAATSFVTSLSSTRWAASLVLAILFARSLRGLDLGSSSAQVAILSLLGGCLCHCLACSSRQFYERGCCSHDPAFWPPLDLTARGAEEDDHKSLLADLVQDYYGPRSMLFEVTENIESVCSTFAPAAMMPGAASATAFTATLVPASVPVSGTESRSNKQHIISFVLIVLLARPLHFMGLCNSLARVALLAGLGGAICCCISAVSAQAELSGRELSFLSQQGGRTSKCVSQKRPCIDDPSFWPVTTHTEEQERATPLAGLTVEYIGSGMLEYVPCFEPMC